MIYLKAVKKLSTLVLLFVILLFAGRVDAQVIRSADFHDLPSNISLDDTTKNYFPDTLRFRTILGLNETPDSKDVWTKIYFISPKGSDTLVFYNRTPSNNTCDSIIVPQDSATTICSAYYPLYDSAIKISLDYGLNTIYFDAYSTTEKVPCPDTLRIFHPKPQVITGGYNTVFPATIDPDTSTLQHIFDSAVNFQARLIINDTLSVNESIKMVVFRDEDVIDTIPAVSNLNDTLFVPSNIVELPDYEPHHIYYKAWFTYFPGGNDSLVYVSDSLHVQRVEPIIEGHSYVEKDADFSANTPMVLFNDSIHFKTQLAYNDSINSEDSIKVVVFQQVNNDAFIRADSAIGITQQGETTLTIPTDNTHFTIDLDPYFNDSIRVYFKAWFIRNGDSFPVYNTEDTSMLRIYHPAPRVEGVSFDSVSPTQVSIINNDTTPIFDTAFQFRAQIEYNDVYSHDQDIICLDVFYQGTQVGQTHKIATDTTGTSPGGDTLATIPLSGDALIPILLDYGTGVVNFRAYFEGFDMEPDSIVNSDTIYINRLKPKIDSMSYESLYPANLSTTDWNIIYTDSVEFRTKLFYNDSVNYDDSIRVIALREVYSEGQAERVDTAYNITIERNPDELFILIPPENEERLMIPLEERYDSILVYFEANFIRDDLQIPDVFYSYDTDTLKIIHPVPVVREVLYDTIVSQSGSIDTTNTPANYFTVFDTAVNVRMQIAYDDTCSVDDELILKAFYNGTAYDPEITDSTRVWGDGSISIPRDGEDLFNIDLEYGDDVADWDTIYFKSYFSKSSDSIVSSDSLFIYRERPRIQSAIYAPVLPNYVNTQNYDTVFHDSIIFNATLHYNDTLHPGDQVKTVVYREIIGGSTEAVDSLTLAKPEEGDSISFSNFQVALDPYFNDSIRVYIKSWFIRPGLTDAGIYNEGGEYALLMYHPAPRVTNVLYDSVLPSQVTTSNMAYTGIFDSDFRFNAMINYNDPFSHGKNPNSLDTICMEVFYNQQKIGETIKVATDSTGNNGLGNTTAIIPDIPELVSVPLEYFKDSVRFIAYFQGFPMEHDSIVKSDTLLLERLKPEIDSFSYLNPYPNNLSPEGWNIIYTDSVMFRTKLWYNDSVNTGDSIRVIALREIYSEDSIQKIDTAYNITTVISNEPDELTINIPADGEERFIVPLGDNYDSILVFFEANFIRDDLQIPLVYFSTIVDTLKIIHPAPAVKVLTYETSIGRPSDDSISPGTATTVFDTAVQVRMQISYDDTCSVEDGVFIKAYFNGQPDGQQLFDYTRVWGDSSIFMPRIDSSLFNFTLQYGDFENDYDYIHFEAYFTKTPDSIVSSDSLIIYRAKPVITGHEYLPVKPDYLSTTEIKTVFHDTITFDLSLTYNDDVTEGDEIETKIFCQVNGAIEPIELETIIQPKPTNTDSVSVEGIQVSLDPYWDDTIRVYFESRILRSDLPGTAIYNLHGNNAFLIYHPRPRVDSVEFNGLYPNELYSYLNEEIEIYNKEVLFGAMVFYNDTFSSNETIRINTIHEYYQGEILERDTMVGNISTAAIAPGSPVLVTFPDSTFAIDENDMAYHKFYMDAWFDEEAFVQQGDTIPSDNLIVRYRINTPPYDLNISTLADTIFKQENYFLKGMVKDTTGEINKLVIIKDGIETIVDEFNIIDGYIFEWAFDGAFTDNPIHNFSLKAQDKVNFLGEEDFLWTGGLANTRLNYAFFDDQNAEAYLPKDTIVRIMAYPAGGKFTSMDGNAITSSGIINPKNFAPEGTYYYDYEIETTTDTEILSSNFSIHNTYLIQYEDTDQVFWVNSSDRYWLDCLPGDSVISWIITGGKILEQGENSIFVEWTDGSTGELQTKVVAEISKEGFNYTYSIEQLVAVDDGYAPEKAILRLEGNSPQGFMLFSSVDNLEMYNFEWYKNNESMDALWNQPYIYIGQESIQGTYHVKITDKFSGSYTNSYEFTPSK